MKHFSSMRYKLQVLPYIVSSMENIISFWCLLAFLNKAIGHGSRSVMILPWLRTVRHEEKQYDKRRRRSNIHNKLFFHHVLFISLNIGWLPSNVIIKAHMANRFLLWMWPPIGTKRNSGFLIWPFKTKFCKEFNIFI